MEKLQDIVRSNPDQDSVYLDYQDISDLAPLVPLLARLPNLQQLFLYGNKLTSLPENLSDLAQLDTLEILNNPITDIRTLIPGLSSLGNLKHLSIPEHFGSRDIEVLLAHLPRLVTLNGKDPHEFVEIPQQSTEQDGAMSPTAAQMEEQPEEVVLTGEDINDVAVLYDSVKQLVDESNDEATAKFDRHVQAVTETLDQRLGAQDDPFVRRCEVFAAKHALFDICFNGVIEYANASDPKLAEVLQQLRSSHSDIIGGLSSIPTDMAIAYQQRMSELQQDVDRAERETSELLEAAELLEKEAQAYMEEKKKMTDDFERQKAELLEAMGWLRSENDKYQIRVKQLEQRLNKGSAGIPVAAVTSPLQLTPSSARQQPAVPEETPRSATQHRISTVREISLLKLKDIIEDIYTSKTKFDQKCLDARLPRETMEQHLYTYLNQKYGLKSLIVEWATAIITAVKKFNHQDNDVAVFGKILRNEIDEEFRFVQQQLKQTVAELLRVYLKGKYPLKRDDDISSLLKKRMAGSVREEEWVDIIKYMYNHDDSVQLIVKVKEVIRQRQQEAAAAKSEAERRREEIPSHKVNNIAYTDFLQVLLDFQLRGHEKFLMKFMKLFRQFDTDKNGILSEEQLRELILAIDPEKDAREVDQLIELADPNNNKQINFSECVSFLSSELVQMMGERPNM